MQKRETFFRSQSVKDVKTTVKKVIGHLTIADVKCIYGDTPAHPAVGLPALGETPTAAPAAPAGVSVEGGAFAVEIKLVNRQGVYGKQKTSFVVVEKSHYVSWGDCLFFVVKEPVKSSIEVRLFLKSKKVKVHPMFEFQLSFKDMIPDITNTSERKLSYELSYNIKNSSCSVNTEFEDFDITETTPRISMRCSYIQTHSTVPSKHALLPSSSSGLSPKPPRRDDLDSVVVARNAKSSGDSPGPKVKVRGKPDDASEDLSVGDAAESLSERSEDPYVAAATGANKVNFNIALIHTVASPRTEAIALLPAKPRPPVVKVTRDGKVTKALRVEGKTPLTQSFSESRGDKVGLTQSLSDNRRVRLKPHEKELILGHSRGRVETEKIIFPGRKMDFIPEVPDVPFKDWVRSKGGGGGKSEESVKIENGGNMSDKVVLVVTPALSEYDQLLLNNKENMILLYNNAVDSKPGVDKLATQILGEFDKLQKLNKERSNSYVKLARPLLLGSLKFTKNPNSSKTELLEIFIKYQAIAKEISLSCVSSLPPIPPIPVPQNSPWAALFNPHKVPKRRCSYPPLKLCTLCQKHPFSSENPHSTIFKNPNFEDVLEKRESIYTDRFVHSLHKKEWRCSCPARIGEFNNWKGKSYKEFKLLSTRSESHRDSSRDSYRDSYRDTRESEEEEEPVAMVKAVQRKFPSRAYSSGQQPVVRRISDSESKTNPDHSKIRKNTDKKLSKPDFMEGSSSNIRKKIISKSSLPPPQTDKEVSSPHSSPVIERPHSQENLLPTGLTNNLPPPTHSWHYSNTQKTHVRSREDRKSVPSFFSKMDGQELLTSSAEEEMEKIRTEPSSEEDSGPEPILDLNNAQKDEEDDGLDPIVRLAIKEFNKNWKDGIKFMKEKGLVTEELSTIAHFLMLYNEKLSKEQLGETLGGKTYKELLIQYTDLFDFTGMKFDAALRKYLSTFMLLGEAQVIDRIMEVFASKYVKDHPGGSFPTKDAAYTMAFSLIMLNTDRHNPAIAENKKMTLPQFLKNNSGLWDGKDPPRELLEELYHAIVNDEIVIRKKGDPDKRGWVKSIKANTYEQGKRWLILINHELRWYKTPNSGDTSGLLGKIPLDYVRIFSDLSKTSFSVASVLPKPVDFFLVNEKGKAVRQEAVEFAVVCENEQQMNLWLKEVRNNVTFNVEPKLDKPLNKFKVNKFRKNQEL